MPRPVWLDKAPDVEAVVEHLEAAAGAATRLEFTPRDVPPGTDLRVLHQAALARARRLVAASHRETDRILAQEVRAVDDLVRSANLLAERLREWYALHAPEATRMVQDPERLARLVAEGGERGRVMAILQQARLAATSIGTDLNPADMAALQGFAAALAAIHDSWHALERRIAELMQEVAPNLASVTGSTLGARLIAQAGGLERLAAWPAGTLQLLGAETALFRHIKEGTAPPKHGILFQHPLVHPAPPGRRGPIARAIALAAATAAKADAFTKNDLRAHLKGRLDADLARIARRPERRPAPRAPTGRKPFAGAKPAFRGPPPRAGAPGPRRDAPAPRAFPGPSPPAPRGETRPGPGASGWRPGPRPGGPPSDRRPPGPPGGGFGKAPPRRKQGAFRGSKGPAKPPGKGDR